MTDWSDPIKAISFAFSVLVFIKNLTTWTIFIIKKFIEQREDVALRPQSYASVQAAPKLDKESMQSMRIYLLSPESDQRDIDGNTELH